MGTSTSLFHYRFVSLSGFLFYWMRDKPIGGTVWPSGKCFLVCAAHPKTVSAVNKWLQAGWLSLTRILAQRLIPFLFSFRANHCVSSKESRAHDEFFFEFIGKFHSDWY